jgi:hypothetical protein
MVRIITDGVKFRIQKRFFWGWKTLGINNKKVCWRFSENKEFEAFDFKTYEGTLKAKEKFCGTMEKMFIPFGWYVV